MFGEIDGDQVKTILPEGQVTIEEYFSSLRYAGVIQQSLLPLPAMMDILFRDYFVTYIPKDIVSGDFYYVYRGKGFFCVAAGDCTGHGVPGALLSILGLSLLNEIMQCQTAPKANRILNMMREKMMKALHQTGKLKEARDSIDMALCIFNYNSNELQFSGANRPLFIIREGELIEIKPDKMPIGLAPLREDSFSNKLVSFSDNDMFYLFSDGFPDQFGGNHDKKFRYSQFRGLISEIAPWNADRQKQIVEETFSAWKGATPQIDDVMVFGFKPNVKK